MTARTAARTGLGCIGLLVALLGAGGTPHAAASSGKPACPDPGWVGAWSASMGHVNPIGYAVQTLRMVVAPHVGGTTARVRLSNPLVDHPVTISSVFLGRSRDGGAALVSGSNRRMLFGGTGKVTIPANGEVVSDPVDMSFEAFQSLAVSLYVGAPTGSVSEHFDGHQLSWIAPGPVAGVESGLPFVVPTFKWTLLGGIDVERPDGGRSVVTLGDSITDGYQNLPSELATLGANERYPDFLAHRLLAGDHDISVLNAGISGNQVTRDTTSLEGRLLGYGPSALSRLDRDVLAQPGVADVIVMEGTNDLGHSPPQPAAVIIDGLRRIIERSQAAGLRVHLGTLPPRSDVSTEQVRILNDVNTWIRSQRISDSTIDFHAVLRDPNDSDRLNPQYDSGDGLHPSSAGYEAMANAIDLRSLTRPACHLATKERKS